jgi:DNA-binding MarR family transcriptional regulator
MKRMLHEQIGYQLKRAQHALRLVMDSVLREFDLTTAQYAALSVIEETPGVSGAALARRCFVTPQTMNAIVVQLEDRGYIARRQHPEHGRVLQAFLTASGQQRVQHAHARVRAIEARMVAGLATSEQAHLLRWLQACSTALGDDGVNT